LRLRGPGAACGRGDPHERRRLRRGRRRGRTHADPRRLRLRRGCGARLSGGGHPPGLGGRPRRRGLRPAGGGTVSKTFVCTCEDVTIDDVRQAIALGHRDIESVKRFTGFGTGPCQGKLCTAAVARILAREAGLAPETLQPFTPRPPARMLSFGELATYPVDEEEPPGEGVPVPVEPHERVGEDASPCPPSHPLKPMEPLPAEAEVVIVGGGIMGLALAYNLAKRGLRDVLVLEAGYLCSGASGRNGGGVRMQWS